MTPLNLLLYCFPRQSFMEVSLFWPRLRFMRRVKSCTSGIGSFPNVSTLQPMKNQIQQPNLCHQVIPKVGHFEHQKFCEMFTPADSVQVGFNTSIRVNLVAKVSSLIVYELSLYRVLLATVFPIHSATQHLWTQWTRTGLFECGWPNEDPWVGRVPQLSQQCDWKSRRHGSCVQNGGHCPKWYVSLLGSVWKYDGICQ